MNYTSDNDFVGLAVGRVANPWNRHQSIALRHPGLVVQSSVEHS